ncbi:MAG: biotin carboxylase, partial [Leucobacter sp.]
MTTVPHSAPISHSTQMLSSLPEIRHHLRTSEQPVFYVSRTATNLLGIDRWVRGFSFITLVDSW